MDSVNGGNVKKQLTEESKAVLAEGISRILSRWTALGLAVAFRPYDKMCLQKVEKISNDIFAWFTQSKEPLYIDDLEIMLQDSMCLFFDTILEDRSEEEVAERMMILHEECLQGKYETLEKLRKSTNRHEAVSRSVKVVIEYDKNVDAAGLDGEATEMLVDEPKERKTAEEEDGWCRITSKKTRRGNRSKKC